jgi:hypothetical protein
MAPKKKKTAVEVPCEPGDLYGPFKPAAGSRAIRQVANWVIKLVRLAETGDLKAREWAVANWELPEELTVPQWVEDADDARFGQFDYDLRPVVFRWKDLAAMIPEKEQASGGAQPEPLRATARAGEPEGLP